ncbi:co-chaperone GroES [Lactobacillus acetotolerans]|uniref:Co-chaperonin GroES n=1 Tax=Lactobacillus acetotolerans TaxID=1600 RepID=A0A0D6A2E4_9LACO|nr:co-chaperone GroES [Lactobacillus acetotolerans]KRN42115.1 co-chaperonin GroES [Lactobacillus acetotolerans DSM 20749 = JCM 3825]MBN7276043.1 co-chaperone GroES [Lactobacillus acetotolerans]QFG50934.1 co-chaperone GroES [Lactobacillus acetotolerans]QGV04960.1 co-chaperone GroES [Lactobacillus acetotolerans]BAQ56844.1 chaperone GroES [Lactobacillus acetotolerans]
MLQPIGDRVIVKVKEEEEKTVGGIVLASNAKQKPTEGEVVAVGEGAYADDGKRIPMTVKKGDVVLYDKYSGTNVKYEGQKYLVLHEKDILAIVK